MRLLVENDTKNLKTTVKRKTTLYEKTTLKEKKLIKVGNQVIKCEINNLISTLVKCSMCKLNHIVIKYYHR